MRRRVLGMLTAVTFAAATAVIGANPAYAAVWTVTPAGTFNGTAGTTLLTDTTTGTQLTCRSSTATGTAIASGNGMPIARITRTTFTTCTGPAMITFTVTHGGTWNLNAGSISGGITTGTITGISARLSGPLCSATVTGSVNGTYDNGTGDLIVLPTNSTLTISGVSGCFGLIRNGDRATFSGTYNVTPRLQVAMTP